MFKQKKLILLFLLVLSTFAQAKEISLEMLIDLAVKNNSNIKISTYKQEQEDASLGLVQAEYYPKISLSGEVSQSDTDNGVSQVHDTLKGVSLSASQLLYDFGKTTSSIKAAKENVSASKETTSLTLFTTVLETKKAYYDVLKAQQQISLYEEIIEIDKLRLEQVKEYHKAGIKTLIDVTDAKLQLANSELKLLELRYVFAQAQANIISIIGVDTQEKYEIKKDSNIIDIARDIDGLDTDVQNLKEYALKNRREFKLFKNQIQAQKYELKSIHAEYYPNIALDASLNDKYSDATATSNTRQVSAGVYLKWNIYTGDTTQTNIKNNIATLSILQQELFQKKLDIQKSIDISYAKVKSSEKSIKISFLTVTLALQKLDLANQRYKAGISDSVELNEATLKYSQAKNNLIESYYTYLSAKAELEYSIGKS